MVGEEYDAPPDERVDIVDVKVRHRLLLAQPHSAEPARPPARARAQFSTPTHSCGALLCGTFFKQHTQTFSRLLFLCFSPQVGSGAAAEAGDDVEVAYVGKLHAAPALGPQFDAAKSFAFTLGAGDVIKGWDAGVAGMRVGGVRTLVVPPKLGYGKKGSGPDIPSGATLHFKVTLKAIQ